MRCTAAIISETAEIAVAFVVLTEHKCWLGRISFISGTIIGRKCQLYFCISSHSVWFHRSVSCWKAFVFALKTERWIFGCIFIIVWSTAVDIKLTNILKQQIQNLMVVGFDLFLFSSSSIYDKNKWGTKEKSGQRQRVNDRDLNWMESLKESILNCELREKTENVHFCIVQIVQQFQNVVCMWVC